MDSSNADEILACYLAESDEPAAERLLHTLITEVAAPFVRIVVASNLRGRYQEETDDAVQDVLLQLTSHLRRMHEGHVEANRGEETPIRNFRAYIAAAARRAAGLVLRRTNPERYRLRNRIRYSLKSSVRFTLTEDEQGRRMAGLALFQAGSAPAANTVPKDRLTDVPVPKGASSMNLSDLIELVLLPIGAPVFLDDLTDYIHTALGGFARQEGAEAVAGLASPNLSEQMELRGWLTHLWTEILELPRNQRVALLLNLRDHIGDSALRFLPATGIASIRQIAAAIGMPPEALAAIWRQLPLNDRQVAETLSLTRQQIVNLRKSARDRLIRRMGVHP
jgi:hypothetical protein